MFRKPKAPESKISKLNKKITKLNEEVAANRTNKQHGMQLGKLNSQLQEELTTLSERWQMRSKAQWIELGERSTRYFFSRYKARHANEAQTKIKVPLNSNANEQDTLQYIRDQYAHIYKHEEIN